MAAQTNPVSSRAMATAALGRACPSRGEIESAIEAVHGLVGEGDDLGG